MRERGVLNTGWGHEQVKGRNLPLSQGNRCAQALGQHQALWSGTGQQQGREHKEDGQCQAKEWGLIWGLLASGSGWGAAWTAGHMKPSRMPLERGQRGSLKEREDEGRSGVEARRKDGLRGSPAQV